MTTTTTMTPTSPPPTTEPQQSPSATTTTHLTTLRPIATDTAKRPNYQRSSSSYAKDRLSTHSNISFNSQNRSRPGSHVFPVFHSSLSYALVRDFAYPSIHPLHYGPLPSLASTVSTPVSEQRRLSDPPAPWDSSRGQWSTQPWTTDNSYGHQQLPAMSFGDGPPYSEDEDLHSPVFSSRHRKNKSTGTVLIGRRGRSPGGRSVPLRYFAEETDRGTLVSMNADGSETYYVNDGDSADDGPGGEYVTYPADESRYSHLVAPDDTQYSVLDTTQPNNSYADSVGIDNDDDDFDDIDRYSRDFQFAVGCPDEEMHGKAVALFDFTREHENELPLVEGQVIFVSYRHGQGWLVAEDPKTGESGLVPEEFVRLLRDIEGGLTLLNEEGEVVGAAGSEPGPSKGEEQTPQSEQQNTTMTNGEEKKTDSKQPVVVQVNDSSEKQESSAETGPPPPDTNKNDAHNEKGNNKTENKPINENHFTKT